MMICIDGMTGSECDSSSQTETQDSVMKIGRGTQTKERKPTSEYKAVNNMGPLTDVKGKFREWNRKFVNAMGQVDGDYETALLAIMKWADAYSMSDLDRWQIVTSRVMMAQTNTLDTDQFNKDLKNVLVEKVAGTVHTKVNNGIREGGI